MKDVRENDLINAFFEREIPLIEVADDFGVTPSEALRIIRTKRFRTKSDISKRSLLIAKSLSMLLKDGMNMKQISEYLDTDYKSVRTFICAYLPKDIYKKYLQRVKTINDIDHDKMIEIWNKYMGYQDGVWCEKNVTSVKVLRKQYHMGEARIKSIIDLISQEKIQEKRSR